MYLVLYNFNFVPIIFHHFSIELQHFLSISEEREGNKQPAPVVQEDGWDSVTNFTALLPSRSEVEDIGYISWAGEGVHLDSELYGKLRTKYWNFSNPFVVSDFEIDFHIW